MRKEAASPSKRVCPCVSNSALLSVFVVPHPLPSQSFSKGSAGMCRNEREKSVKLHLKNASKEDFEFILLGRQSLKLINNKHNSCLYLCGLENRAIWALMGEQRSKELQINYTFPTLKRATCPCRARFKGKWEWSSLIYILSSLKDHVQSSTADAEWAASQLVWEVYGTDVSVWALHD